MVIHEQDCVLKVLCFLLQLRVFKLAKSWPTLNLLIGIIGRTLGEFILHKAVNFFEKRTTKVLEQASYVRDPSSLILLHSRVDPLSSTSAPQVRWVT